MAKPKKGIVTGSQTISYSFSEGVLFRPTTAGTYADYRELRKDPTAALGRGLLVSGVLGGSWSVESDEGVNEAAVDFIKTLMPLREEIMRNAVGFGRVDFGWMGFEKVFTVKDGRLTLEKLKPLLQDMTTILIDRQGNFTGYKQQSVFTALPIIVPLEKCLHIAFDVEGGDLYGTPLLEHIRATQSSWDDCDAGAKRYDTKIAGSHFVVHYPPGTSEVDGETVDNSEIANKLLTALESSGSMALPSTTADYIQELVDSNVSKLYEWDVTLLSDTSARQPTFIERLKYLDALKIRGLILPERSMLEGQFGTKAEAGEHIGLAVTGMQEIDKAITREINSQCVDQLLDLNWGLPPGSVRFVAVPLVDLEAAFLRALYIELVPDDFPTIDTKSLKEQLHVPIQEGEPQVEIVAGDITEDILEIPE